MIRSVVLLVAVVSIAALGQEVSAPERPPLPPEAGVFANPGEPVEPLRPLSRGDRSRFRVPRGPIPAGFHLVEQPRWGLVVGGASAFAVGTGAMVAIAVMARNAAFAIPLAGPFIAVAEALRGQNALGFALIGIYGGAAAIIDFAAQVAGIVMFVLGLTRPARWLAPDDAAKPSVMLVPGAAGAPLGASLVARF